MSRHSTAGGPRWLTLMLEPSVFARRLMVDRVAAGWPAAHVAEQLGVSRATVYKWLRRYAERPVRPVWRIGPRGRRRMPARTPARVEQRVLSARAGAERGAVVLAAELGLNPSTVGSDPGSAPGAESGRRSTRSPASGSARHARRENRYEHPRPAR